MELHGVTLGAAKYGEEPGPVRRRDRVVSPPDGARESILNPEPRERGSASAIESSAMVAAWYRTIGTSEQANTLFPEALADPDAQTSEQWLQFVFAFHGLLLAFPNSFYLARQGSLDERIDESLSQVILGVKEQPGFQRYWQQRRAVFFEEFQAHIDAILSSDRRLSEGVFRDISS